MPKQRTKKAKLPILDSWPIDTHKTRVRGGGDRERETGSGSSSAPLSPRTPRRLSRFELVLGRWLRSRLGSSGGTSMVRRYGWRAIIDALKYDVMEQQADVLMSGPAAMKEHGQEVVYGPRRWVARDELTSPGGFLRACLRDGEG